MISVLCWRTSYGRWLVRLRACQWARLRTSSGDVPRACVRHLVQAGTTHDDPLTLCRGDGGQRAKVAGSADLSLYRALSVEEQPRRFDLHCDLLWR
jgi:hypothetical protein